MEATFARIRQATGVNTLEEMVLKLANQSTNHTTLEEEKREAESKLARAKAARQSEDTRFSYMKASGVGNTELNRDISDKLNAEIQEYRVEVKTSSKSDRTRGYGIYTIWVCASHLRSSTPVMHCGCLGMCCEVSCRRQSPPPLFPRPCRSTPPTRRRARVPRGPTRPQHRRRYLRAVFTYVSRA